MSKTTKNDWKKNSRFDKKNEFSIFFNLIFVNESKFVVFVFSSLDSLSRNSRRFRIFFVTLSLNWSFNTTSKLMFTTTTFITSSIFDISRKSNVSSIFDFLLIIVENSIVSSNIQHLKFFNFIFSSKISTRLLFFSIVRRSKIEIKKTRNIRDTMNDVFTSNVFDSRIDDFNIITQTKNILSKIIESTTNQNKQNDSTNQLINFNERFNQNVKIQFAIFIQRLRQKTTRQSIDFDFYWQKNFFFEQINRSNANLNLFANTTSKIELFEQFLNESRLTIASITTIFIIIVSIIVVLIIE